MFSAQKDLGAEIKCKFAAGSRFVAAGAGDNSEVTGPTIDRYGASGVQRYNSAVVAVGTRAVLTAAATLSLRLRYQESADGSNWDAAVELYAPTVVSTGGGGGSTEQQVKETSLDLSARKRYLRFLVTPDLSAGATDTGEMVAQCILGGGHTLPAT